MKTSQRIPYNLQLFAEDNDTKTEDAPNDADKPDVKDKSSDKDDKSSKGKEKDGNKDENTPDIQQMMTDYAKLKRAFDKTSSELAETKKALKERMTEQERASEEKAEAEAIEAERVKNLERENTIFKAQSRYLDRKFTADEAMRAATAEADGDFDELAKIEKEVDARKDKEREIKFLAERPEISAGSGSDVLTKEKFDQMDYVEKTKLLRNDPDTYNKFVGRK